MTKIPRLFELMSTQKIKAVQLSNDTGIPTSSISDWKSGKSAPGIDALLLIADYFECTVDYILGRTEILNSGTKSLSAPEERLIDLFRRLPPIEQGEIIGEIKTLVKIHENALEKADA